MGARKTTQQFIEEAKKVHGERYDYTLVNYKHYSGKIEIICKVHGKFLISPQSHLTKQRGCRQCSLLKEQESSLRLRLGIENFINRSINIHNKKYTYENVVYVNNNTKVSITCKKHGDFMQVPSSHLYGNGCPSCNLERDRFTSTKEDVMKRFLKKHGNKYIYEDFEITEAIRTQKINVVCHLHGLFTPTVFNHLRVGCRACGFIIIKEKLTLLSPELKKRYVNFKRSIKSYIERRSWKKDCKTGIMLGLSWEDLIVYLESNPYGFKVSDINMDIDHIVPISSAKTLEDVYKLNHYTNLQLLPSYYNRVIKLTRPFDKADFEKWLKTWSN